MRIEWDNEKASKNKEKHGIAFGEASSAFYDSCARIIDDPDHSQDERRYVIVGLSLRARVLVACYCHRSGGEVIRLISARRATRSEEQAYWRFRHEG